MRYCDIFFEKKMTDQVFDLDNIQQIACKFDPKLVKMGWYCRNSCVNYEGGYDCSG